MNIIKRTSNWLRKNFTRQEVNLRNTSPIAPTGLFSLGNFVSGDSFAAALKNWTFICISKRANAIANLNWLIEYADNHGNTEPVEQNHPLRLLFQEPNAYLSKMELLKLIQYWYDVNGNALLKITKNGAKPVAMWNIPIVNMQMDMSNNQLKGYTGTIGSNRVTISPEDVIHFRHLIPGRMPEDLYNGKSLVDRVIDLIATNDEMNKYLNTYFKNEGLPPVIAHISKDMMAQYNDPAKVEELRDRWNARNPNNPLAGVLIDTEIKPIQTTGIASGSQSIIPELDKGIKQTISAIFGVPMGLITGEQSNRATAEVNERHFYKATIEPLAFEMQDKFNKYFNNIYPDIKISFEAFDYSDKQLEVQRYQTFVQSGIMTRNEVRSELGLSPLQEEVNEGIEQLNFIQKVLGKNAPKSFKDLNEMQKTEIWKYTNKKAEKHEKRYNRIIKQYYNKLRDEIKGNVNNQLLKVYKNNEPLLDADFDLFDIEIWNSILSDYFTNPVRQQIVEDMQLAFEQVSINYDNIESKFDTEIKLSANEVIDKIKIINNTVDVEIREQIRILLQDNLNLQSEQLANLINDTIDKEFLNRYTNRANTIARTTTTQARGEAKTTAWDSTDEKINFVWLTERDGRVRKSHRAADGQEVENGDYFKVGTDKMKYPAGGSKAEENINCRCDVFPELK